MSAGAINPRTGAAFGTGPWNSAETGNLTTRYVASTATLYVANPGTGATKLDRTDAQWLETTGRLQNGATFDMTTRDVNSGTHNVAAVNVGIDPAWAVGVNDDGNGNATDGATQQITIGGGLRFSNKTAGGGLLRPTVQTSRMAIGTLSINDASGFTVPGKANPLRALTYSDSTNGSSPYILANYANISTGAYVIFQNEQFVTVNAPDITYGTANQNIQGDTPTGDVKALIANTQNSVIAAFNGSSAASPVAGLEGQGYIPPQLMQVKRAQDGLNIPGSASQIVTNIGTGLNTQYNSSIASGSAFNSLTAALAMGDPTSVTAGGSSLYGANSVYGGVTSGNFAGATGFVDQIQHHFGQLPVRQFQPERCPRLQRSRSFGPEGSGRARHQPRRNQRVQWVVKHLGDHHRHLSARCDAQPKWNRQWIQHHRHRSHQGRPDRHGGLQRRRGVQRPRFVQSGCWRFPEQFGQPPGAESQRRYHHDSFRDRHNHRPRRWNLR